MEPQDAESLCVNRTVTRIRIRRKYASKGYGRNFFGRSRRPRDVHARVPFTAASVTAQPCRPDGRTVARRLRAPIQTRGKTRKAFQHNRYMRVTLLVNQSRSTRRAGKVEHMSCAIGLTSATHLRYMHSEHPFMLEIASSPLTKLPCSPPRTNLVRIEHSAGWMANGGCKSLASSGNVVSSSARWRWSVWSLPCSRERRSVAPKRPSGDLVSWTASAAHARSV